MPLLTLLHTHYLQPSKPCYSLNRPNMQTGASACTAPSCNICTTPYLTSDFCSYVTKPEWPFPTNQWKTEIPTLSIQVQFMVSLVKPPDHSVQPTGWHWPSPIFDRGHHTLLLGALWGHWEQWRGKSRETALTLYPLLQSDGPSFCFMGLVPVYNFTLNFT